MEKNDHCTDNNTSNRKASEEENKNKLDGKAEANKSTISNNDNTDDEYEETVMVMHLDGKYDANLLRSCILNGGYKLRTKDDGNLVVQIGHSVFNATFTETCGSDLLLPVTGNPNEGNETFDDPITSDIRLVCKKTNNPFFKDPEI
uniref:Uncharacterized protein n=1 Tax=Strongyloides papillosus TaxID=174720 RepID=A0A0N5BZ84_STREA